MTPDDAPVLGDILANLPALESEVPVAKNNSNTIDLSVVPVIFVPGVMGTRLEFAIDGGQWDPDSKLAVANWVTDNPKIVWKRLRSNTATIMGESSVLFDRGFEQLVQRVYGTFLTFLADALKLPFCPVHAVGYDWTQSNDASAKRLDDEVQRISKMWGAKKVIVVTHSMGGLVFRAACLRPGFVDRVIGVVHTVQPVLGSSVAYRQFLTGATAADGSSSFSIDGIGKKAFDALVGNEWWKYMAYMSAMQGPLELLPNARYQLTATDPSWLQHSHGAHTSKTRTAVPVDVAHPYGVYLSVPCIFPSIHFLHETSVVGFSESEWDVVRQDLATNIIAALGFHLRLGQTRHPTTSVIASTQNSTCEAGVHGIDFPDAPFFAHEKLFTVGDDTVSVFSATAIPPCEDGVDVPTSSSVSPKRLLLGPVGGHQHVFDNGDVRTFLVENIKYLVQKTKAKP